MYLFTNKKIYYQYRFIQYLYFFIQINFTDINLPINLEFVLFKK